jgi:hypothetical protein
MTLIEKLNGCEHAITYELVQVRPDRAPVVGEIRYLVPLAPMPGEPLASMIPLDPASGTARSGYALSFSRSVDFWGFDPLAGC